MKDTQSIRQLRKDCELAKRKLSKLAEVTLTSFLSRHDLGYSIKITRALFQDLCMDLFQQTMTTTEKVLADSGVSNLLGDGHSPKLHPKCMCT